MSPWRYSVFSSPISDGLNGRRAMPMIRSTSGALSSWRSSARPMSPVGPVIATVRPMPLFDPVLGGVDRGDQAHVAARDEQEGHLAFLPGLERGNRARCHREELRLALVHVVREARAVSLGGQVQRALDPVALDLDDNLLPAKVHDAA